MGICNANTGDEIFQIYEKLAVRLTEMSDNELPFEEAVYSYFQSFNPTRKLNRSEIPYCEIKDYIEKLTFSKNDKSAYELPSATDSRYEKEIFTTSVSFVHHDFFSDAFNKMPHELNNFDNTTLKVDRRTALYKRSRKVNIRKREFISLDCHESELLDSFEHLLNDVLASRNSSIDCCSIIVNSLAMFFSRNTWSSKVQDNVIDFLQNFVVSNSAELCEDCYFDDSSEQFNSEKTLLKIQVMCLLELFSAKLANYPIEKLSVIEKLHLLRYNYGKDELCKFINEALQQEFGQSLPFHMSKISEVLKTPVVKKKRKLSNGDLRLTANETGEESESRTFKRRNSPTKCLRRISSDSLKKQSISCSKFEDLDDENSSESYSNDTILREKIFGSATDFSGVTNTPKLLLKTEIENGGATSRRNSRATNFSSRKNGVTKLVRNSLTREKNYVPCYRRIDSSSEEEVLLKDIPEATQNEINTPKVSRTSKIAQAVKLPHRLCEQQERQGRVIRNRNIRSVPSKKSSLNRARRRLSSPLKLVDVISKKSENLTPSTLKSPSAITQRNVSTINSSLLADSSRNAAHILNNTTVAHYKKRMEVIKSNARALKFNNQELFYGRCHARRGLFDEKDDTTQKSISSIEKNVSSKQNQSSNGNISSETGSTSSATANCGQKNRSGRVINAPTSSSVDDCVHIAHTLLNVHNGQPLAPFKARHVVPDGSGFSPVASDGFRVRKFVKPANRTERRRMEKFKKPASAVSQTQNSCNVKGTPNS